MIPSELELMAEPGHNIGKAAHFGHRSTLGRYHYNIHNNARLLK